jgi:hypothetical protein
MGKRLNPQRRRELKERQLLLAIRNAVNPSSYDETVRIRSAGLPTALWGSSAGLERGLLHGEANMVTYKQHKRRKPTPKGGVVSKAGIDVAFPHTIPDKVSATAIPASKDVRRISRPNKVVPKTKKVWSAS